MALLVRVKKGIQRGAVWYGAVCFTHNNVPLLVLKGVGIMKIEMSGHFQGLRRKLFIPSFKFEDENETRRFRVKPDEPC
jgi:hypothetical protein